MTRQGPMNTDGTPNANSGMFTETFSWTADGSGAASVTTSKITGLLLGVETNPDGTDVPTSYGVTVTNEGGRDLLGGGGASRSTSATEYVQPKDSSGATCVMPVIGQALTIAITGAGSGKKGVVRLEFEKR